MAAILCYCVRVLLSVELTLSTSCEELEERTFICDVTDIHVTKTDVRYLNMAHAQIMLWTALM